MHFTNHSYHATDIEAYTKCMLRLEECNQVFFPQYANAQQPFPLSVMIVDDHFYNIMSLFVTANPDAWRHPNTTHACNGINCGIVLHARTLVVKCPQSLSPSSGALAGSIFIILNFNEIANVECNLEKFLEYEQNDIALFANTSTIMPGSRSTKRGITACFAGEREEALEWAIYHHMIGFDHVWIYQYVNEQWKDGKDLSSLDFVTFIPYSTKVQDFWAKANISAYGIPPFDVFRVAFQNDALWRAKRMRLDWMAFLTWMN